MARLRIQTPENAQGPIKAVYDRFLEGMGRVPGTLQLFSASPALFERQMNINLYFRNHDRLSFPLQCLIRYLTARECRNAVCEDINRELLERQGMSTKSLDELKSDVTTAPVEPSEQHLLEFVSRALAHPDDVSEADLDALREDGWQDSDIFDAVYHGTLMVSTGLMTRIFKMD